MVIYRNTTFGYKRFSGSEDIKTIERLNVRRDPDLEYNKSVFSLYTLAYDDLPSN